MSDNFLQRLKFNVLVNRNLRSWGKDLGVSDDVITKLEKGFVPGIEVQLAIRNKENCDLVFLNSGVGSPFNIENCSSSEDFIDKLTSLMTFERMNIYIIGEGSMLTLVFQRAGQYHYQEKTLSCIFCHVLCGPFDHDVYQCFKAHQSRHRLYLPYITSHIAKEIIRGEHGVYSLFGDDNNKGLLNSGNDLQSVELIKPVETITGIINSRLMRAVMVLVEQTIVEQQLILSSEEKSEAIAASYTFAINSKKTSV